MAGIRAPFGTWDSDISAEAIAKSAISFQDVLVDPVTSKIYHLEGRPSEGGRAVIVDTESGNDVFGAGWDARTGVYEYGGGSAIVYNNVAYFSNSDDGRVYRLDLKARTEPTPITPESRKDDTGVAIHRYASFAVHPVQNDILVAIFEDHDKDENGTKPENVVNTLVQIDTSSATVKTLLEGDDFYAGAKFSPDGKQIAWQQWSHPDMPWEGGIVYRGDVVSVDSKNIEIRNPTQVGGKKSAVSAAYPSWASNNTLVFTSDVSGFINPWKYTDGRASAVLSSPVGQEFGAPMWSLSIFPYAIVDDAGQYGLFVTFIDGRNALQLVQFNNPTGPRIVETPYVVVSFLKKIANGEFVFVGKQVDEEPSIVRLKISNPGGQLDTSFTTLVELPSFGPPEFKNYITNPEPRTLKTQETNEDIHIVYYPPRNPNYAGPVDPDEKPPCVVNVHGGPTGLQEQGLSWGLQYFTSRGFGWLDVNYGGSSGYGRAYINRLVAQWGVVDVSDCQEAPKILGANPLNLVDSNRLLIRGGSSGGYTTLAALACAPDVEVFAAGTSSYGISNLIHLEQFTHKFESHYMYNLLGGSSKEIPEVYKARSPYYQADRIKSPLLLLQGGKDRVVPKEQSEAIRDAIEKNGGQVEYHLYPDEGHGWRQEANIADALDRELSFYRQVLGL